MNSSVVPYLEHINHLTDKMDLHYVRSSLYGVCGVLSLLIVLSFVLGRRKTGNTPADNILFTLDSTLVLKGLAIILLLLGHISQQCTEEYNALSYRMTANAAVIIFLFVSGVGLAKKYQLHVDKQFLLKRIKKLAMPVWLTLLLFIALNFLLIGHRDPVGQLALNFCGIFWTQFPNNPCWFITYILFLYAGYFTAALLPVTRITQLTVLFLLPFIASWLIIETGSIGYFALWPQYSLVFPTGVVCGLNTHHLRKINDKLFDFAPIAFIVGMLTLLVGIYWTGIAVHRISHLVSSELYTQLVGALINPVALILFLILFVGLLEMRGMKTDMLQFLGKYSFEMYLLHFPFMVYYDFFLFRRPLVFFFFVYAIFILLLSVVLQRTAVYLDGFIFRKTAMIFR